MVADQTILVVEDDPFIRDIFQRCLERAGFRVRIAVDGNEALASFHKGGIGLVLTDILMPEMDGFQLIRALKHWAPKLPVIAISIINDLQDARDAALTLGAALAICKPVNPRDLVKMVRQYATPSGNFSIQ